jgi:Exostosin family
MRSGGHFGSPVVAVLRVLLTGAVVSIYLAFHATVTLVNPPIDLSNFDRDPQQAQTVDKQSHAAAVLVDGTFSNEVIPDIPSTLDATNDDDDDECIFRNSTLYRKIYVYPNPGTPEYAGSILSEAARASLLSPVWPWIGHDRWARDANASHYDLDSQHVQYSTELLVREVLTNPGSCLRTHDPEAADLFYVPYLPSTEFHRGTKDESKLDYNTSPFGRALLDVLVRQNYTLWESPHLFGFTSRYWRRRGGRDHVVVFSEPFHGLLHARYKRGSYHYLHSQQHLSPAIIVSVELSKTFVEAHPKCAAMNVLLPYPNTDGRWFNGMFEREARQLVQSSLASNRSLVQQWKQQRRPATMYLSAGIHGRCKKVRRALEQDYRRCSPSYRANHAATTRLYRHGMRISTFCPAPGGDSPSSKRMFDCLHAGSIPVVLSRDFVWPFTEELGSDGELAETSGLHSPHGSRHALLSPGDFSIRLNAGDYAIPALDPKTCKPLNASRPSLESFLESIRDDEIRRLQAGVRRMSDLTSWYRRRDDLPDHPLQAEMLPDGGAAHHLVKMLEARVAGTLWNECKEELMRQRQPRSHVREAIQFKC